MPNGIEMGTSRTRDLTRREKSVRKLLRSGITELENRQPTHRLQEGIRRSIQANFGSSEGKQSDLLRVHLDTAQKATKFVNQVQNKSFSYAISLYFEPSGNNQVDLVRYVRQHLIGSDIHPETKEKLIKVYLKIINKKIPVEGGVN